MIYLLIINILINATVLYFVLYNTTRKKKNKKIKNYKLASSINEVTSVGVDKKDLNETTLERHRRLL